MLDRKQIVLVWYIHLCIWEMMAILEWNCCHFSLNTRLQNIPNFQWFSMPKLYAKPQHIFTFGVIPKIFGGWIKDLMTFQNYGGFFLHWLIFKLSAFDFELSFLLPRANKMSFIPAVGEVVLPRPHQLWYYYTIIALVRGNMTVCSPEADNFTWGLARG